ncbi:MAG: WD40/YVTN/BNR-like repeat-containing protein, partial [Nitrospira sp.]
MKRSSAILSPAIVCLLAATALPASESTPARVTAALQKSGTAVPCLGVQFRDTRLGWTVGAGGTILKTIDGGVKWKPVVSGTTALLTGVSFPDKQKGWVVGANGTILHSSDGGSTWRPQ